MQPEFKESKLVKGDFKNVVALPKYVDIHEWIASNTFDFFNLVNMFYGVVSENCTSSTCSIMGAGPNCEFLYSDNQRKVVRLPAPQYVDYVMSQIQSLILDESIFPTKKAANAFPKDFFNTLKTIYLQLFRVLAHIYWNHYKVAADLRIEAHLNSLFMHFIYFSTEFDLLDKKELACMSDYINNFL
ncbi:MOB kinase activator-like 1-like protein [Smittium culicis]|uniref:MOB kinase activator-like 1-like protein n=1 Tax=Smittium culicis TaxID=133412 RepID=A0A1R1Y4D4_9FUNG|nr:MOB kinase activator-like 1-like protein [Smittium culicis]OMJ21606.1 MOB kinase activator-like 1-like protein [Smittium culicis]